jgi:ABC-type branched-subunit amino acid transport system substrate-binding protein
VNNSKKSAIRCVTGVLLVLVMTAAACGRSGDESEDASGEETPSEDGGSGGGGGGGRLDNGEFGDLGTICQDGQPGPTPDEPGITDTEIHLGTVTDKSAEARPELTKEMYDTAVAFAEWCNEQGGINGRQVVIDDLDAQLTQYPQRIEEACQNDFALVGGGAVFDNADNGARVQCGLINFAGYVVTPQARVADLQVQPVPNPVFQYPQQQYLRLKEMFPDVTRYGVLWVDIPGPATVHQQLLETLETNGYDVVYDHAYAAMNEQGWTTFIDNMRDEGVQAVEMVGEPDYLVSLLSAMQTQGWYPEYLTLAPNMYDERIVEQAAAAAGEGQIYIRHTFPTFDMGDEVPAMADYQELMESYNPEGRYPAFLGAQALSGFLLFAKAANDCGAELSRQCVLDAAFATQDWTAGGLHAPTTPGNLEAANCGMLIRLTTDGFVYDEEATDPDDGVFNCNPDNLLELQDDYGVERPQR